MDTSWLSNTSSGVFNYLYKHITGEDDSVRPSSSLDVLSKANVWITDLPTNNYEPLEASHGARRPAKKSKRERELEEKIAVLKEQCNAKNQEIACLEEKVSRLREDEQKKESDFAKKMQEKEREIENAKKEVLVAKRNYLEKESEAEELSKELNSIKDKFAKCRKPDESLCSQVSELKKILVRREEINTKQKQLFRMLAADAQKKLDKASVDTRNLSEELKSLKAENSDLAMLNDSLQSREKELQRQLTESNEKKQQQLVYIAELEITLADTDRILKELSDNILKKDKEFKSYKERDMSLEVTNASLKQQLTELQEKLENMTNTQIAERAEIEKVLEEKSQQIAELNARNTELEKEVKKKEQITTKFENCKEREKEFNEINSSLKDELKELKEKLDDITNLQTEERAAVDKALTTEKSQQIVELSCQLSARNVELEREINEKESITTALENSKEREKELKEITDSSLKDQLKEIQERLEDTATIQPQKREQVALEQADISQQIVELHGQMNFSNALQNVDAKEKKMEALLENCKEQKEKLEQACNSLNKPTSLETVDVSEMSADVVKTFNADDYFEAKSSPFDDFSANKEVGEQSYGLGNVFDDIKDGDCLKNQPPLPIAVTNEAESHAKEDITVPREKAETEKLKADGFSGRSVNPFSKAALRGKGNHKPFVSMTNVVRVQVVHDLPVLRKRHETDRAEGFSSISNTVNPFSMSARDGSIRFQPRPSSVFPVTNPTAAQVAQTKKDDDWFPQNQAKGNLVFDVEEQGFLSRTFGKWFGF